MAAMDSRLAPHLVKSMAKPGHGEACSNAHNQHQLNCRLCEDAGTLHQITGERRNVEAAADQLSRCADGDLNLRFRRARNTNPLGRILHQIRNENTWLMFR